MERTKFIDLKQRIIMDPTIEPLVISKPLIDLLGHGSDALLLYIFYYYHLKYKNNKRLNISYTAKGLNWGIVKTRNAKRILLQYDLVEDSAARDDSGKILYNTIILKMIFTKEQYENTMLSSTVSVLRPVEKMNPEYINNINIINKKSYTKNKKLPIANYPQKFQQDSSFVEALQNFIADRSERKKPMTTRAHEILRNKLIKFDIPTCIKALNMSIEKGWSGVFPESMKSYETPPKQKQFQDDSREWDRPLPDRIMKLYKNN